MYIYLVCFAISCLFFASAGDIRTNRQRYFLFTAIGLLLPCILAGTRAITVGTDVAIYTAPLTEAAVQADSFMDFRQESWVELRRANVWLVKNVADFEWGFCILIYIVSKIFGSLGMVLFAIQVLVIVPVYKGICFYKEKLSIWFAMLVFYLMFYSVSLNLMRQSIAMSFLFLGVQYLNRGRNKVFFILYGIAISFHMSAIIGIIFFVIYKYLNSNRVIPFLRNKSREATGIFKISVLVGIAGVSLLGLDVVRNVISNSSLARYGSFIKGDLSLDFTPLIWGAPIFALIILKWKQICEKSSLPSFLVTMFFYNLIASQLNTLNSYAFRITIFFQMFNILLFSTLCKTSKKRWERVFITVGMVIYLLIYWYYYYVYKGHHSVMPYEFASSSSIF